MNSSELEEIMIAERIGVSFSISNGRWKARKRNGDHFAIATGLTPSAAVHECLKQYNKVYYESVTKAKKKV